MEAFVLLGLIVIIIFVATGNNRLLAHVKHLELEITSLRKQLQLFLSRQDEEKGLVKEEVKSKPPVPEAERWMPKAADQEDATVPLSPKQPFPPVLPPQAKPAPMPAPLPVHVVAPPPRPKPGFFERNPDLEKFIGENLISKIGIAILVIAVGFFVKYSIDQGWVGPAGRVGIGLLCGGILVGLAHRLQRNYKAFSSVLVGGGLAIFYFSIALAYKDYGLFGQTAAFIIMVVITVFAILLSLLYDRQEVAIIALLGGFAVPFMVSNGSGNYITLFTYLLLLNTGLLVIAYRKAWRLLNGVAFVATVLLFSGWMLAIPLVTPHSTYIGGFLFATAFYLLFLAINLAHNIRGRKRFIASDFGIMLANTALYFSAGMYLLYAADAAAYKGLFSAALGMLNFALTAVLIRRRSIDTTILYLLIGITLTFASLAAPLQLEGHFITLFWSAECVVLLWLLQKSGIRILQWGLLAVWVCSLISLLMDWSNVYAPLGNNTLLPVLANKAFITTLFAAGTNAMLCRLLLRNEVPAPFSAFEPRTIARTAGIVALLLLYSAGALEIFYQFSSRHAGSGLAGIYLLLYTNVFVLALWIVSRRGMLRLPWIAAALFLGACHLFYLVAIPHTDMVHDAMLTGRIQRAHIIAHWLSAALTTIIFYQLNRALRLHAEVMHSFGAAISWISAAFAVTFVSVEIHLLTTGLLYKNPASLGYLDQHYVRVGLPIIWGLCSFAMMWLGMRHKYRPLRIASLTLFSITLLKLFLFDIRDVGVAGKIAAFFCLGVLLLVVSFMYQRLKKLIIEDERKADVA